MRLENTLRGGTYWYCADAKMEGDCSDTNGVGEALELHVKRKVSHDII
jgi:hypothetical protein